MDKIADFIASVVFMLPTSAKEDIEKFSEQEPVLKPAESAALLISLFILIAGFIFLAFL